MACRDEQARPRLDDQVSLGSYRSDAYTLPCDPMDDDMCSEISHDSYDSYCREEPLPSYRVPREQGVSQSVYEAWIIYYTDKQEDTIQKTTFCGLPVCRHYAESHPYASCITEPHTQEDLSAMARSAVDGYHAAHKRSLPSRLLRGRPKSYEGDLDARIQKLPRQVQSELDALLGDREAATGNRFHKRDWTVAMMREQYRYRFASAEYEEVKKGGKRFWKKGSAKRPSEYFFVIRGGGGAQVAPEDDDDDDRGRQTATRHGNPWKRVDDMEYFRKQNARDVRRYGKNYERLRAQVRGRSPSLRPRDRSPSPPSHRVRLESEGPAVPNYRFPNPFTPSPHFAVPPPHPMPHAFPWASFPPPGSCPPPPPPPPPPPTCPSAYHFPALPFSRLPPPPPPPPPMPPMPSLYRDLARYGCVSNHDASTALDDFDFDRFLRDEVAVPPQYTGPSPPPSPPPAPRLSNLTTPTTFSPASSARGSGSSVDGTEVSTPVDGVSVELRVGGEGSVFGG